MYKLLVLAVVLASAYAGGKKCPMAFGKYPLDEQKLVGQWNVVASTPVLNESFKCAKMDYQVTKDAHVMAVSGLSKDGKPLKGEIYATPYFGKEKGAGLMMAVMKKMDGTYTSVMKHSIIATDYDNYAVFLACKQVFDESTKTFGRHIKAGILSRQVTLPKETLDVLKNIISGYDIDAETFTLIDQTNC